MSRIRREQLSITIGEYCIRSSCLDDLQSIRLIERYSFSPNFYRTDRYLKHLINVGRFFVCCYKQIVVGYIGFQSHKRYASISELAVRIDFRRQSVASILLSTLISKILFQRFREIRLFVAETNAPAIALYDSFSFKFSNRLVGYYGDVDGIQMIKKRHLAQNLIKIDSKSI